MIDHILFNQAFWMKRTDDVKNKLNTYQNLQNQVNSLQSFKNNVKGRYYSQFDGNGEYYSISVYISEDGRLAAADAESQTGNNYQVTVTH